MDVIAKTAHSSQLFQDPECCGQGFEPSTSHTQSNTLHPELPNPWFQAQFLMQMFIPIYLKTINNKLKKKKLQLAIWLLIIGCKIITTTHFVIKIFCLSAMAIKTVTFWSASHIAENSVNFLPKSPFQDYAITHTWEDNHTTTPSFNHGSKPLTLSGFSMEGGTWWLIATYFGIYSRLLCV